jgi:hypothetical protein
MLHFSFRCCICCSGYTPMMQMYVLNVSPISDVCCKCFIWMLHMLQWLYMYLQTYVLLFHLVSVRCDRRCSPCALTRGQACTTPDAPAPLGVVSHGGACSQTTHVHPRCAPSLSLSLSHCGTRADLSHTCSWVSLALGA